MVIGIGKVCAVHHATVDVLDHDVVWWRTKFFCKIVTTSVALLHTFFSKPETTTMALPKKKYTTSFISLEFEDVFYEH